MDLDDIITTDSVIPRLKASSKKQVLQELARKASEISGLEEREVFDVLLERERLGTTGVGGGLPFHMASWRLLIDFAACSRELTGRSILTPSTAGRLT